MTLEVGTMAHRGNQEQLPHLSTHRVQVTRGKQGLFLLGHHKLPWGQFPLHGTPIDKTNSTDEAMNTNNATILPIAAPPRTSMDSLPVINLQVNYRCLNKWSASEVKLAGSVIYSMLDIDLDSLIRPEEAFVQCPVIASLGIYQNTRSTPCTLHTQSPQS